MLLSQKVERINLKNIISPPPQPSPEKKEEYEKDKINGVMEIL